MAWTTELVDRWVEGWGDSRSMSRERVGRSWFVDVAAASRSQEYIIASPSLLEVRQLVTTITSPDLWLTVVGAPSTEILEALSMLDAVTHDEMMMMAPVVPTAMPDLIHIEEDGAVAHARIEFDGEIAARGQVAVRGTDVIFDRIETTPSFRRRGLGRLVMAGLTSWAAEREATTGLLMASADGRHLYRSLGWREVAPIATFRGVRSKPER